jgi:arylsulfatase A-like enzyme
VPLIVKGPRVAIGRSSDALINSTDLYATILEMGGLDVDEATPSGVTLDSISFLPDLLEPDSQSRRQWVYADVFFGNFAGVEGADYAMRDERYKLLRRDGVLEFYDLMTDPFEHINLLDGTLSEPQEERYQWLQAEVTALRGSE